MFGTGIAKFFGLQGVFEEWKKKYQTARLMKVQTKRIRLRNRRKVFIIGFNKTGTTSTEAALKELGYISGDQWMFTLLFDQYLKGQISMDKIIDHCETAEFFQDVPFSFPNVWKSVYEKYPDALYILTVRNDENQWFNSLHKFQKKVFGDGKQVSEKDLRDAYGGSGMAYRFMMHVYPDSNLYDPDKYMAIYQKHNQDVKTFFENKTNFLELNVAKENAYEILCSFLGEIPKHSSFPWLNKTPL